MLIAALFSVIFQAQIAPPDVVRGQMDSVCAGWRLATVIPEVADEIRTRTPAWPPNLIPGDFNGDGKVDVAMLVECRGRVQLHAFLAEGRGYSRQALDAPQPHDARQFLHLIRKEYGFDAIGVEFEAIGGRAFMWRDGRWISVSR